MQIDNEVAGRTAKASVVSVDFVQMSGSEMDMMKPSMEMNSVSNPVLFLED